MNSQDSYKHPWKKKKDPAHVLHRIVSRPGSMPPHLARYFINKYSSTGNLVLDPFCGKGTVLLEACLLGRKALGFDVALDAIIATNAKVDPPTLDELLRCLFLKLHRLRNQKDPVKSRGSTLAFVAIIASRATSNPKALRPRRQASSRTVPFPQKGSNTRFQ